MNSVLLVWYTFSGLSVQKMLTSPWWPEYAFVMVELKDVTIEPAKLKLARGNRALTDVAETIGITKQRLWNYENGISDPPSDVLVKLCLIYRIPVESLTNVTDKFLQKLYIIA